jgi:predicted AAA+ superfamily ATPase
MTGQLQDAGNTTTLAHYLDLLSHVGMVTGLSKFAGQVVRQRGSSPKLQVYNTALISASSQLSFDMARNNPEFWGRLVESAIGAYLVNSAKIHGMKVFYWRDHGKEIDFILQWQNKIIAIEVKSTLFREALPGMDSFCEQFNPDKSLVVGSQNLSVETFLKTPVTYWFD